MDTAEQFANAVIAIKEDPQLRKSFTQVLQFGTFTQQARVSNLLKELESQGAPNEIKDFVKLLGNDTLAHLVWKELNR